MNILGNPDQAAFAVIGMIEGRRSTATGFRATCWLRVELEIFRVPGRALQSPDRLLPILLSLTNSFASAVGILIDFVRHVDSHRDISKVTYGLTEILVFIERHSSDLFIQIITFIE